MTHHEYDAVKSHLLGAINVLAPTGVEQRRAVSIVHDLEYKRESDATVVHALIDYLFNLKQV